MARGACMVGGVHGRECVVGACMTGGGGMCGWGAYMVGGCMARGVCMPGMCVVGGGHAWQERWPLQQKVCILLECILVN